MVLQFSRRRIQGDEILVAIPVSEGALIDSPAAIHFDGGVHWIFGAREREGIAVILAFKCIDLPPTEMAVVRVQLVDARSNPPLAHKPSYPGVCYPEQLVILQLPPVARLQAQGLIHQGRITFSFSGCRLRQARRNQSGLSIDWGRLLRSGEGADVVFHVGQKDFPAHRAVVQARSPTLAAEIHAASGTQVEIEGSIGAEIFGGFLQYLYTDQLPRVEDIIGSGATKEERLLAIQRLFVLAERFQMEGMKELLEEKMFVDLDVDTSAATLVFAQDHGCLKLQEKCCHTIVSNGWLHDVIQSEAFSVLKNRDYPMAAIDSLLLEAGRALKRPRNAVPNEHRA